MDHLGVIYFFIKHFVKNAIKANNIPKNNKKRNPNAVFSTVEQYNGTTIYNLFYLKYQNGYKLFILYILLIK